MKCQVVDGAYDRMKLKCTDQAILSDSGIDKSVGYSVPLEIMPSGQFEPLYKTTLSIQVGSSVVEIVNASLSVCFPVNANVSHFQMEGRRVACPSIICLWSSCYGSR